ncbi:MAG: hypothetical protein OEZ43_14775 [Gammaproteobacteria bacterium]|nr:hypothetical protein [Gammaproteobacteria bacterium]
MPNYIIVETSSHAECIYSQVLFLKEAGNQVHFIGDIRLKSRVEAFGFDSYTYYDFDDHRWTDLLKVRSKIVSLKPRSVIFNTAHGNIVRSLCLLPYPKEIKFVGIAHNVNKLRSGFSQKMISRKIKNYFVLSDDLEESQKGSLPNLSLESFYPIFYPSYRDIDLHKPKNEIWVTIPGEVLSHRKDYPGIFDAILNAESYPSKLKIIVLGRCKRESGRGLEILDWINENNMSHVIRAFDYYIDDDLFHSYIKNSDYIMPAIHPVQSDFDEFLRIKISGAFNLAYAYNIPMLSHEKFREFKDFCENSVFYRSDSIIDVLTQISQGKVTPPVNAYTNEKWSFKYQQEKYLKFCS